MELQATGIDDAPRRAWSDARKRDFLFAFVALTCAVLAVALGSTYIDRQNEVARRGAELEADARVRAGRISNAVSGYVGDILFLAGNVHLQEYLARPNADTLDHLGRELVSFARQHPAYSQIRLIDNAGREAIRIVSDGTRVAAVPPERLQDQATRPYFSRARAMPFGSVYISPFDLAVADDKIEEPWNPTLRFATPVLYRDGLVGGVFVINIRGDAILSEPHADQAGGTRFEMLNKEGYWLAGAPREKLFGFIFDNKVTFAAENPAAWRRIEDRDSGRFRIRDTLYAFSVVAPQSVAAQFIQTVHGRGTATDPQSDPSGLRWIVLESYDLDPWRLLKAPESWTLVGAAFLIVVGIAWAWSGARHEKRIAEAALRNTLENLEAEIRVRTAAFRESEERFRKAFDVAPHGMVLARPDGTLIRVNREFADMLGYAPEELEGRDVNSVTHEDDRAVTPDTFARLKAGEPYVRYEKRYIRKDGSPVWIEGSNAMVDLGDGSPPYFVGQVIDVTAKRAAMEALERSEHHLRAVLDNAPNAIVSIDQDGGIVNANRAAGVIFGCDEAELMGAAFSDFIPGIDPNDGRSIAHTLICDPGGKARSIPLPGRRRNGAAFSAEVSLASIHEDDEPRLVAIVLDVTEREETENRLRHAQKMEAVGRLTGGIAHDFNNLLTVIIGNLQLLKRSMVNQNDMARVDKVIGAAKSGAEMTRRLLTFSRQQVLALDIVDINELIGNMEDLLRRTVGEHIAITIAPSPQKLLGHTDANQLESAILNLCINAMDAMPNGGRLTIETGAAHLDEFYARTHPEVIPGDYAMVAVSDTGTGILPELMEHIFEPFFTTKEAGRGTGLGLSTIYGFMKQTEGHVSVYSEIGQGTTFKLYVRLSHGQASQAATLPPQAAAPLVPSERRILVVEDEPAVREIAVAILESAGFKVVAAESGVAALRIVDAGDRAFDLIFSDIVMPGGISGVDLAKAVRDRHLKIPILLASGYAERALRDSVANLNGDHFIAKPYDADALLRKAMEILETVP